MTTLETLITSWLENPPEEKHRIPYLHMQLWRAVAEDHIEKGRIGIRTSPTQDPKVKWAVMFLEVMDGDRKTICPHIEANARFALNLPFLPDNSPPSGKDLAAANDR